MKVVLDEHGIQYPASAPARPLFSKLKDAGLVEHDMEDVVLGLSRVRNKRGGHGSGAIPHTVGEADAQAVIGAAANALAYLHTLLP